MVPLSVRQLPIHLINFAKSTSCRICSIFRKQNWGETLPEVVENSCQPVQGNTGLDGSVV